jgi:hypothetical protein
LIRRSTRSRSTRIVAGVAAISGLAASILALSGSTAVAAATDSIGSADVKAVG